MIVLLICTPVRAGGGKFKITNSTLVSIKNNDGFAYELTYLPEIQNQGIGADKVSAIASIDSPHTQIIDANVEFGSISSGQTKTGMDTYTIRHDKRFPFDKAALKWSFSSLPPDPGKE